jgi:hypothetical protein
MSKPKNTCWSLRAILGALFLGLRPVHASPSVVTEQFLDTVRKVESDNGRLLVGDEGHSLGPYQMSEPAWNRVSEIRRKLGYTVYRNWRHYSSWETVAREYARDYTTWLELQIIKQYGSATPEQVYAAYNCGFHKLKSVGGQVSHLRKDIQDRCALFSSSPKVAPR